MLSYSLKHDGQQLRMEIPAGLRLPEGGLVFPWPYADESDQVLINGKPAVWINGELRVRQLPAQIVIAVPRKDT